MWWREEEDLLLAMALLPWLLCLSLPLLLSGFHFFKSDFNFVSLPLLVGVDVVEGGEIVDLTVSDSFDVNEFHFFRADFSLSDDLWVLIFVVGVSEFWFYWFEFIPKIKLEARNMLENCYSNPLTSIQTPLTSIQPPL